MSQVILEFNEDIDAALEIGVDEVAHEEADPLLLIKQEEPSVELVELQPVALTHASFFQNNWKFLALGLGLLLIAASPFIPPLAAILFPLLGSVLAYSMMGVLAAGAVACFSFAVYNADIACAPVINSTANSPSTQAKLIPAMGGKGVATQYIVLEEAESNQAYSEDQSITKRHNTEPVVHDGKVPLRK